MANNYYGIYYGNINYIQVTRNICLECRSAQYCIFHSVQQPILNQYYCQNNPCHYEGGYNTCTPHTCNRQLKKETVYCNTKNVLNCGEKYMRSEKQLTGAMSRVVSGIRWLWACCWRLCSRLLYKCILHKVRCS